MKLSHSLPASLAVSCLALALALDPALANGEKPPAAAAESKTYEPTPGQQGKDVIWLPTAQAHVDRMLNLGKVTAADYVIDLGSGDGRTVITAAKRGARALGIEYNPNMVEFAQRAAAREGVADRATFRRADIFQTDFSDATVLTLFLLPSLNVKLRPTILNMKPGTRVVSNSFDMAEWEPDVTERTDQECTSYCTAHLWIVPAKVDGAWKLGDGELVIKQEFQNFTGTLKTGSGEQEVKGRLDGVNITFSAGGTEYTGKVAGDTIEGTRKAGGSDAAFKATRGS